MVGYDRSANEMKVFIGLLFLQGIDSNGKTQCLSLLVKVLLLIFSKIMSGGKFDLLHKCLHLVDIDTITDGPGTKLAEIKPFVNLIGKKFVKNYIPNQNISIDETLLAWKGNLSWVKHIPAKA